MKQLTNEQMLAIVKEDGWGIRNLRVIPGGREGDIIHCSIYYRGKKVGTMVDDATGGACRYDWRDKEAEKALLNYEGEYGYIPKLDGIDYLFSYSPDIILFILITDFETMGKIKKACKTGVCFRLTKEADTDNQGYYMIAGAPYSQSIKKYLIDTYGTEIEVYNETYNINCYL